MDLRMIKTRSNIKEAFLVLREKLMPDKIKVKDICSVAMINKTTFYKHYTDSNELSNEIDDQAIDEVLSEFPEKDKIFDDPNAYILGLLQALERRSSNLQTVFRGKQEILCIKLEEKLHCFYDDKVNNLEDKVMLSFAIGGFMRVVNDFLFTDKKYNMNQIAGSTARILEGIIKRPVTV